MKNYHKTNVKKSPRGNRKTDRMVMAGWMWLVKHSTESDSKCCTVYKTNIKLVNFGNRNIPRNNTKPTSAQDMVTGQGTKERSLNKKSLLKLTPLLALNITCTGKSSYVNARGIPPACIAIPWKGYSWYCPVEGGRDGIIWVCFGEGVPLV